MASNSVVELLVKVATETGQLEVLKEKLSDFSTEANKAAKETKDLGTSSQSLKGDVLSLAASFGIATTAVEAIKWGAKTYTDFVKDAIKESIQYEEAMNGVRRAVEIAGGSWEKSRQAVEDWANAIEKTTKYSDDVALAALDRMTRTLGNEKAAMAAVRLATDMSAASHQDLASSVDLLTNLFNDNARGVMEAKRQFGDLLTNAKSTADVIQILQTKLAGLAEKETGAATETEKLKNNINNLKQSFGDMITKMETPVLRLVNEHFDDLVDSIKNAAIALTNFLGPIGNLIGLGSEFVGITKESQKASVDQTKARNEEVIALKNQIDELKRLIAAKKEESDEDDRKKNKRAEGPMLGPTREDMEKYHQDVENSNARLIQMEADLQLQTQELGADTFAKKRDLLDAEEKAATDKINKEKGSNDNKEKAIHANKAKYTQRKKTLDDEESKFNRETALRSAETAINAIQTINSMSEMKSKADARRAKMLLALEQAITIARIWSSHASMGPWGIALAAASTALAVAQFAAQSKAIDKAVAANQQQATETSISTPLTNGETLTETFQTGNGSTGQSGGVGTGGGSGFSGGGGGGGGGGAGTIINVGGVVVNFSADSVDINNVDMVARRLGEAVKRGTTDAIQLAQAVYTAGEKNSGVAR